MKTVNTMKSIPVLFAVLAAAGASAQNLFSVSVSPTNTDVQNVTALFAYDDGESNVAFAIDLGFDAKVGTTTTQEFGTNVDPGLFSYGLLGTYGADGLTLGVDSAVAGSLIGKTWEELFTNPLFSKQSVRSAVETDNVGLTFLFADYVSKVTVSTDSGSRRLFAPIGSEITLINFSRGSNNGSGSVQAVPEPATVLAMAAGLAALGRRRRAA